MMNLEHEVAQATIRIQRRIDVRVREALDRIDDPTQTELAQMTPEERQRWLTRGFDAFAAALIGLGDVAAQATGSIVAFSEAFSRELTP